MKKRSCLSLCAFWACLLFSWHSSAQNKTYYVTAAGNDQNDGQSPSAAWATIAKVNSMNLEPGDQILFEGGKTFSGTLELKTEDSGTPLHPVVITSFGSSAALLNGGVNNGITFTNSYGMEVRNLRIAGSPGTFQNNGIELYSDNHLDADYIRIDSVEVYGFGGRGILVGAAVADKGFTNLTIEHSSFHDNGRAGLETYGAWPHKSHRNLRIAYCKAYNNFGAPISTVNTGNGIVVSGTDGGVIEYCEAYNNGQSNISTGGGPVGIWVYDTKNVTIQFCESHHNKAGLTKDGGGFDIDGGSENCIIQYCYSHDNEGPGYALVEYGSPNGYVNNIVRYNISQNDGRKNSYGAILLWAVDAAHPLQNSQVYNNTVYVNTTAVVDGRPSAIQVESVHSAGVVIRNNIFYAEAGANMLTSWSQVLPGATYLQNNNYYAEGNGYHFIWNNTEYLSFQDWRAAAGGQEKNGNELLGMTLDPLLMDAGTGTDVHPADGGTMNALFGYRLNPESPVVDKGLSFSNMGSHDFFGMPLPLNAGYDLGASEALVPVVLAVAISSFEGYSREGQIHLQWTVRNEDAKTQYEIQRSYNGTRFDLVGRIDGDGTSVYSFREKEANLPEGLFYRIRYAAPGGAYAFSKTIRLENPVVDEPTMYFNEAAALVVKYNAADRKSSAIEIFDCGGRLRFCKNIVFEKGSNRLVVDPPDFTKGIYFVRFAGFHRILRFVK